MYLSDILRALIESLLLTKILSEIQKMKLYQVTNF